MFVLLFVQGNVAIIRLVRFAIGPEKTVVSIDLFLSFFMPFSYNGVYFRAAQVSYPISIMTLLFYYLAPLQNCTDVTSLCMQFIFGDKGAATCLIRECPTVSHVGMCQVCLLGTSLHLRMALYTALPVTEKELSQWRVL